MEATQTRSPSTQPTVAYVHGSVDDEARRGLVETLRRAYDEACPARREALSHALDLLRASLEDTVHPGTLIVVRGGPRPFVRKVSGLHIGERAKLEIVEPHEHVLPLVTPVPLPTRGAA